MGLVDTLYSNQIDFYLSFGIGLTFAIFLISLRTTLWPCVRAAPEAAAQRRARSRRADGRPPAFSLRADASDITACAATSPSGFRWPSTSSPPSATSCLVPAGSIPEVSRLFFIVFAFIYTPLISYVSAKLEGLSARASASRSCSEAAFILSGYKGVAIWFAPIPLVDYGPETQSFRVVELTGTKVTSLIKTELVTIPVVIVASFLFSEFIWRLGPIPSEAVSLHAADLAAARAEQLPDVSPRRMSGGSKFLDALYPTYIAIGWGSAWWRTSACWLLSLPTLLMFGFVRGLGAATPGQILSGVPRRAARAVFLHEEIRRHALAPDGAGGARRLPLRHRPDGDGLRRHRADREIHFVASVLIGERHGGNGPLQTRLTRRSSRSCGSSERPTLRIRWWIVLPLAMLLCRAQAALNLRFENGATPVFLIATQISIIAFAFLILLSLVLNPLLRLTRPDGAVQPRRDHDALRGPLRLRGHQHVRPGGPVGAADRHAVQHGVCHAAERLEPGRHPAPEHGPSTSRT